MSVKIEIDMNTTGMRIARLNKRVKDLESEVEELKSRFGVGGRISNEARIRAMKFRDSLGMSPEDEKGPGIG